MLEVVFPMLPQQTLISFLGSCLLFAVKDLSSGNPGKDFGVESEEAFDWQFLEGALVLLGAAGRCQRRFAQVEEVVTNH